MINKLFLVILIITGFYVAGGLIHDYYLYGDDARCFNVSCMGK